MATRRPRRLRPVNASRTRGPAKKKSGGRRKATRRRPAAPGPFRARVRMYRQGLGDCFLLTFPRPEGEPPCNILIDCGVLGVGKGPMVELVGNIRDAVPRGPDGKARLDVIVATHEKNDHLSGFNQAREIFNDEIDVGAVWMGWTENLSVLEIRRIKEARRAAVARLQAALTGPAFSAALSPMASETAVGISALLNFSSDDDKTGTGRIADALEYLKQRGKAAGDLKFLEPGEGPFPLPGVEGVRVYVLGPPRDPILLKGSEVTEQMKRDNVIYHLDRMGTAGLDALSAAAGTLEDRDGERYHPFGPEYRIARTMRGESPRGQERPNPRYQVIQEFIAATYDDPRQRWRRIDDDWMLSFGQLALDLDNDTNNTSLVLAFEFEKTGEVLLFVGDAQVGNWQSWADLTFTVPGRSRPMPAHDLLARTVFYKVGHHCSHNGTLKAGGLELMNRKELVAFIPLDEAVARKQGKKGWDMPAGPLFRALKEKTGGKVVISDRAKAVPPEATAAGVRVTDTYVDYFI